MTTATKISADEFKHKKTDMPKYDYISGNHPDTGAMLCAYEGTLDNENLTWLVELDDGTYWQLTRYAKVQQALERIKNTEPTNPAGYIDMLQEISSGMSANEIAIIIDSSKRHIDMVEISLRRYDGVINDMALSGMFCKREFDTDGLVAYEYFPNGQSPDDVRSNLLVRVPDDGGERFYLAERFGEPKHDDDFDDLQDHTGDLIKMHYLVRTSWPIIPAIRSSLHRMDTAKAA